MWQRTQCWGSVEVLWQQHPPQLQVQGLDVSLGLDSEGDEILDSGRALVVGCAPGEVARAAALSTADAPSLLICEPGSTFRIFAGGEEPSLVSEDITPDSERGLCCTVVCVRWRRVSR